MMEELHDLLEAVMAGDWQELEAGCGGDGPVVRAHKALGLDLPDEVVEYLSDDEGEA